jgi:thioredoxin-like negative regulator of GroEL
MQRLERITTESFEEKVLGSELPVLVEFSTSSCPACRSARPILENLAEEFEGRASIVEVNVEEEQDLGGVFQIRAVPTLVFFKNGRAIDGVQGTPPAAILRRRLEQLSESCAPKG